MEVTITQVELRKIFNVYNKTCTYYSIRTDVRQYGTEKEHKFILSEYNEYISSAT